MEWIDPRRYRTPEDELEKLRAGQTEARKLMARSSSSAAQRSPRVR